MQFAPTNRIYNGDYMGISLFYNPWQESCVSLWLNLMSTYAKTSGSQLGNLAIMNLDSKLPNLIHHHPLVLPYRTFQYI